MPQPSMVLRSSVRLLLAGLSPHSAYRLVSFVPEELRTVLEDSFELVLIELLLDHERSLPLLDHYEGVVFQPPPRGVGPALETRRVVVDLDPVVEPRIDQLIQPVLVFVGPERTLEDDVLACHDVFEIDSEHPADVPGADADHP